MYYIKEKKMRTMEDKFENEDFEVWTCKKCKNHNIHIEYSCARCNKNKSYYDELEKEENKIYFCKYCGVECLKVEICNFCNNEN